ncbi:MAG: hypothetical protein V4671_00410 [Armatimonadota bacterium]
MSQMSHDESSSSARPQVVKMLTKLLEKANQGEITSIALVAFNQGHATNFSSEFTEMSDLDCAPEAISRLKKSTLELALKSQN